MLRAALKNARIMSKSDTTKALIMRAAVREFTDVGYSGVALRDIAQAAGVTMGVIRYHFGTKIDLYRDTLAYLSEQYNSVCRRAMLQAQADGDVARLIYSWLAAPITHWQDSTVAGGEEVLCFLNRMGYEAAELTREVYESHYAYAFEEWTRAVRAHFPGMQQADWLWCLTCLRGMYFNIVAHNKFTLWSLPGVQDKEQAIRRLSEDAVRLLRSYAPPAPEQDAKGQRV